MAEENPIISTKPKLDNFECKMDEDSVSVENNGKIYTVTMDCRNFKPEEICIQITSTLIKIEGKHETEDEAMEFYEEYIIPEGVTPTAIQCLMNSNGALRVQAPVAPKAPTTTVSQSSAKVSNETSKVVQKQNELMESKEEEFDDEVIEADGPDVEHDAQTLAKHEDISQDLVATDDKFQLKLNLAEFKSKEVHIRTSTKQRIITITATKTQQQTSTNTVQEICKRFTLPEGAEPKSIVGNLDKKTGVLTITGKRTVTQTQTQTVTKEAVQKTTTETVEQKQQVQQQQQISTTATATTTNKNVTVIHKAPAELIDDSDQLQATTEVVEINQRKYVKITAKVPQNFKPDQIKVTMFKNVITITIRQETTTTVRTIYRKVTVKNLTILPQGGKAEITPDSVLEILAPVEPIVSEPALAPVPETKQTKTIVEQKSQQQQQVEQKQHQRTETTRTVETSRTEKQSSQQMVEETKIQPKISNEVVTQDTTTNAEDITKSVVKHIAEGKTFHVEINVSSYKAEEIEVKIMQRTVTIRGKQERKESNQSSSQEFYKMFTIPEGINPEDLQCTMSKSGILKITSTKTTIRKSGTTEGTVQISPAIMSKDANATQSESNTSLTQSTTSTSNTSSGMQVQTAENFERKIEAFGYKPEEIEVKIKDNWIIIQGKQKMSEENNFKSREFMKKFTIPPGLKPEEIITKLSPEGILTVTRKR